MPGTPHSITRRGKKVRITLKTGEVFEDVFLERTPGKVMIFQDRGRVLVGDIRAFSDVRPVQPRSNHRRVS